MLRQYSAIIDLSREKVSPTSDDLVWITELIGSKCAPQIRASYYVRKDIYNGNCSPKDNIEYSNTNEEIWRIMS